MLFTPQNSVFLNNMVHLIILEKMTQHQIAAFDICSEEWNTLRLPMDNQVSSRV